MNHILALWLTIFYEVWPWEWDGELRIGLARSSYKLPDELREMALKTNSIADEALQGSAFLIRRKLWG